MRRYYRFRATRFYGGCVTGDVVGCNLRCKFCWSRRYVLNCMEGRFYKPGEAWGVLEKLLVKTGYSKVRLSGGEPTIGFNHLLKLLEYNEEFGKSLFIIETNGILIGARREYARELSRYSNIHVRVSIKACSRELFNKLTGAIGSALDLQVKALGNLADYGVSHHPAIVSSFGGRECFRRLLEMIREVDPESLLNVEEEIIVLYPRVRRELEKAGLKPRIAWDPRYKKLISEPWE